MPPTNALRELSVILDLQIYSFPFLRTEDRDQTHTSRGCSASCTLLRWTWSAGVSSGTEGIDGGHQLCELAWVCAVAERRNSSRALKGPRSLSGSKRRMRLRRVNSISIFFCSCRDPTSAPVLAISRATSLASSWIERVTLREGTFGQHRGFSSQDRSHTCWPDRPVSLRRSPRSWWKPALCHPGRSRRRSRGAADCSRFL
jgi:hypothetical protein